MSQCPVSGYLEVQHVQERVEGGVGVASPEHHRVQGPGGLPVLNMQGEIQTVSVTLWHWRLAAHWQQTGEIRVLKHIIVKLRQGSGKDRQGMAVKAKDLKA